LHKTIVSPLAGLDPFLLCYSTHGLHRGLHSYAASRLKVAAGAPAPNLALASRSKLHTDVENSYCTVRVTISEWVAPPAAVAITVTCETPTHAGEAALTKADPGDGAALDVARYGCRGGTGHKCRRGIKAGGISTVPFWKPATAQVTVWSVEPFTVAANCCGAAGTVRPCRFQFHFGFAVESSARDGLGPTGGDDVGIAFPPGS